MSSVSSGIFFHFSRLEGINRWRRKKKYMAEAPVSHWVGTDCPGVPSVWDKRRVRLADAEEQACSVSGHFMSAGRGRTPRVSS